MNLNILKTSTLILLLAAFASSGCSKGADSNLPDAPQFSIKGGDESYSLSDFKGKMVILNFWATWCPPCKKEIPDFIELYEKYADKGLVILGVSMDQGGWLVTKQFADDWLINYPIAMANRDMLSKYGSPNSIPTTFIITPKGKLANQFVGYRPREVWENEIKKVLNL
jgi:thiol-disulfide isomerase/thioredoxin